VRYRATPEEIATRHAEWEIIGPAEIRAPIGSAFNPYRVVPHAELRRLQEAAPEINPHLASSPAVEAVECMLVEVFIAATSRTALAATVLRRWAGQSACIERLRPRRIASEARDRAGPYHHSRTWHARRGGRLPWLFGRFTIAPARSEAVKPRPRDSC